MIKKWSEHETNLKQNWVKIEKKGKAKLKEIDWDKIVIELTQSWDQIWTELKQY